MWLLRLRYIVTIINRLEIGVVVIGFLGLPADNMSAQLTSIVSNLRYGHAGVLGNSGVTIGTDSMIRVLEGISQPTQSGLLEG